MQLECSVAFYLVDLRIAATIEAGSTRASAVTPRGISAWGVSACR
jgi:hypothetical protein